MSEDLNAKSGLSRSIRARLKYQQILADLKATGQVFSMELRRYHRKFSWKKAFRIAGLTLLILFYCLMVGAAVVIFPPLFAMGMTALPVLILIWVAPELRRVPTGLLRKAFLVVVFIEISIPAYYAVQFPGSPWISIRRLAVFSLIVLFAISVSGSARVRDHIYRTLKSTDKVFICIVGYYTMAFLSLFTSANITESIPQFSDWTLNWYVPMLACIITMRTTDDLRFVLKLIGICSLFVTALGVADFVAQRNYAIEIIPSSILNAMMEANPALAKVAEPLIRNGQYRADSVFNVPLSYGEFAAMMGPIGCYFALHGEKHRERAFGLLVVLCSITSLFVSGARGGSIAFLVAMPVFIALWVFRTGRANPRSMAGPIVGALAFMATTSLLSLVFTWRPLRNMVLGGGDTVASDTARFDQAQMAWPHILANPVTGHGIGNAGVVVGYVLPGGGLTIDSSLLVFLVETGIPGFLLYFGILIFAAWSTARIYVQGNDRDSSIGGALAGSFIAYAIYRLVLAQRENQSLLFILLGVACVFVKLAADRAAQRKLTTAKPFPSAPGRAPFNPASRPKPRVTAGQSNP